jgi:glycine C-acetyltransferase
MEDFEKQMTRATKMIAETGGGILVITEGVFGMAGDQGRLKEICDFKSKFDFRLMVDDAHGFGTMGEKGAGVGELQGCQDGIDIYFSTFAKSMASIGAFVAGEKDIINYLRYNLRSQIYAKTLPMPIVIGNLKRLELLRSQPQLKAKLWENALSLQSKLKEAGFDIGNTNSPVTPVYMHGGVMEAANLTVDMRENYNIFCSIVVYPVIPKGHIILRLIPSAVHTEEDIVETIEAFKAVKHKLDNKLYPNEIPNMS